MDNGQWATFHTIPGVNDHLGHMSEVEQGVTGEKRRWMFGMMHFEMVVVMVIMMMQEHYNFQKHLLRR